MKSIHRTQINIEIKINSGNSEITKKIKGERYKSAKDVPSLTLKIEVMGFARAIGDILEG